MNDDTDHRDATGAAARSDPSRSTADPVRGPFADPVRARLLDLVRAVLEAHWVEAGYTAPNDQVYPWQWLWDSCFHAVVWAELGDDRGLVEVASMFSVQATDGFVPHMNYVLDPGAHADLWGRRGASSITQPPMYGHALAELARRGLVPGDELVDRARRGLRFLVERRRRHPGTGLVTLCHPWESGADDSPRWDGCCPGGWDLARWREHKLALVASVVADSSGSPVSNPEFDVASVGFNALLAFNIAELATLVDDPVLAATHTELVDALADRWDPGLRTWVDAGTSTGASVGARSVDGLLPVLVTNDPGARSVVWSDLLDDACYGGACGPAGVHRDELTQDPAAYWRGPAWPQLSYLFWVAARRWRAADVAADLGSRLAAGARRSGLAEYWHPDTGAGLGAIPQSWAGLALLVGSDPPDT